MAKTKLTVDAAALRDAVHRDLTEQARIAGIVLKFADEARDFGGNPSKHEFGRLAIMIFENIEKTKADILGLIPKSSE